MIALEAAMTSAIDDEWWTTEMVCAHLKLSKRALWDLRAHPTKAFPVAIKPGGKINLFRAAEVRAWMETRARPGGISAPEEATPNVAPAQTTEPEVAHADQPATVEISGSAPAFAKRSPRTAPRHTKDERQLDLI
jgi:predicted DNA-binding transcriptional regulator AlpA